MNEEQEEDKLELRPQFIEKMRKARKEHLEGKFISLEELEKQLNENNPHKDNKGI